MRIRFRHEKALLARFEKLSVRFGRPEVKHAAAKFVHREQVKAAVDKERKRLEARLAELK